MASAKKKEQIRLVLTRSLIGVPEKQRRVVRALGLGKTNSSVVQEDNPSIRGMIFRVSHLVDVERMES
jgi:large subunit ribosomal protein L30